MKAKEMTQLFNESEDKVSALSEITKDLVNDTVKIIKDRKLQNVHSLQAVFNQQRDKWKAFCRQTGVPFPVDYYDRIIAKFLPDLKPYL